MEINNPSKLENHINYLEGLLEQNKIQFTSLSQKVEQQQTQQTTENTNTSKPFKTNLPDQDVLSKKQIERYCRQMQLEDLGIEGQVKIAKTKILVIGAGGIGSPALMYLAGMGVGKIGIIDDDTVDETNLHRQVIHSQYSVGIKKVESALKALQQFNTNVKYEIYSTRLTQNNATEIFQEYDLILDASDNPKTRYLVNDTAVILKKTLVSGSAIGWEGQLTVYGYKNGPCYRCIFPTCPPQTQSCGVAGVIGMIPGTIGILEALEAMKIILDLPGTLQQKFVLFDGKTTQFKEAKLRPKQDKCIVCGSNPTITSVKEYDYDQFVASCQISKPKNDNPKPFANITWPEFVKKYQENKKEIDENAQLVDVRFETQARVVRLQPFTNIPFDIIQKLNTQEDFQTKFNPNKAIYVHCRKGVNSRTVSQQLADKGYNVFNIQGGIEEYSKHFDNTIPFF